MKRIMIAIFATFTVHVIMAKTVLDPVTELIPGQSYGDRINFRVYGSSHLYDTISEAGFLSLLAPGQCFLYKWTSSVSKNFSGFSTDDGSEFKSTKSDTVKIIEAAGLPVFVGTGNIVGSNLLSLFPQSEIDEGFILGVVNKEHAAAYDITSRCDEYKRSGSYTAWDGRTFVSSEGELTGASYVALGDRGNKAFYEDLMYGQQYIAAKDSQTEAMTPTVQDSSLSNLTETVGFTNIVITTYYTNKTVIVDPYFHNLNSILKFNYPKYAEEGCYVVYKLERLGVLFDPLTVHVITNGHWCADVKWVAGEGGTKTVRAKIPIGDKFDDNAPLEVLVKTLNRKVDTSL